ncbi:hypothetical protein AZ66_28060 [Paenibacillus sp. E194]|nr:hypothetical protein AZ66_28060 [Paenibacillus sp. E194]
MLANLLGEKGMKVDTLISIATPVREYKLESEVGQHIQMYNNRDMVQMGFGRVRLWMGLVEIVESGSRIYNNT